MSPAETVIYAIGAHGLWKNRLVQAIHTGKTDLTLESTRSDLECDFGRWLHQLPPAAFEQPELQRVRELHWVFHQQAARTLELAMAGRKPEALQCLEPDGAYTKASRELMRQLVHYRKRLQP